MRQLTAERLEEIFERVAAMRVAVVGDLMLDVYLMGSASRMSPEAPVPVVQVTEERVALGGAANVAANVVALGASCRLVGCVGRDGAADEVRRVLAAYGRRGLSAHLVEHPDRPTTTKTRVMARHQQVVRFDRELDDDVSADCSLELSNVVRDLTASADVLVLEDYNKGALTPSVIRAALDAARVAGIPSVVDPKFRNFFEFAGATVFKPNAVELRAALASSSRTLGDTELEDARRRLGCTYLLVTLGEEGMVLRSDDGTSLRIPAVAREVYDVSGAGDTVTACVAVCLAAGATMEEAMLIANYAAAIGVGKQGVAVVEPDEIREFVKQLNPVDTSDRETEATAYGEAR